MSMGGLGEFFIVLFTGVLAIMKVAWYVLVGAAAALYLYNELKQRKS